MSTTAQRLELYEAILSLIEKKRLETRDDSLGDNLERVIVESQFEEIERDILERPGAIEPWLIRRRREN